MDDFGGLPRGDTEEEQAPKNPVDCQHTPLCSPTLAAAVLAAKPSTETELYGTRDVRKRRLYRVMEPNRTQQNVAPQLQVAGSIPVPPAL